MTSKEKIEIIRERIQNDLATIGDDVLDMLDEIEKDLEILEKYRELFSKIINSDFDLEYTGKELKYYYEIIEKEK